MANRRTNNVYTFFVDSDSEYLDELVDGFSEKRKVELKSFYSKDDFLPYFKSTVFTANSIVVVYMGYYFEKRDDVDPLESGIELLKEVKEYWPEAHVIMLSKEGELIMKSKALRFGAYEILMKNELIQLRISNSIHKIISRKRLEFLRSKVYLYSWIFLGYFVASVLFLLLLNKLMS